MKETFFILGNYDSYCDYLCSDCFSQDNVFYLNKRSAMGGFKNRVYQIISKITTNTRFEEKFSKPPYKYRIDMKKVLRSKNGVNHLIIFDSNLCAFDFKYLTWIRKKIKNLTVSLIFINSSLEYANFSKKYFENLFQYYDNIFTWDKADSERFGFQHIEGLYSKRDINEPINNDVFFVAGKVKDRREKILEIYNLLLANNFKCDFIVVGLKNAPQGIHTSFLPYEAILKRMSSSKAVLDIGVKGQVMLPLRAIEAIVYDKILVTNSDYIKQSPFYDSKHMLHLDDSELIAKLKSIINDKISYHYDNEYSINNILRNISQNYKSD